MVCVITQDYRTQTFEPPVISLIERLAALSCHLFPSESRQDTAAVNDFLNQLNIPTLHVM